MDPIWTHSEHSIRFILQAAVDAVGATATGVAAPSLAAVGGPGVGNGQWVVSPSPTGQGRSVGDDLFEDTWRRVQARVLLMGRRAEPVSGRSFWLEKRAGAGSAS